VTGRALEGIVFCAVRLYQNEIEEIPEEPRLAEGKAGKLLSLAGLPDPDCPGAGPGPQVIKKNVRLRGVNLGGGGDCGGEAPDDGFPGRYSISEDFPPAPTKERNFRLPASSMSSIF
jgi:hypothetical protein